MTTCHALLAEFDRASALLSATRAARAAGFTHLEAYAPFSVDGLSEALGFRAHHIPLITLLGGIIGAGLGFGMQWYSATIDYPINVGGRPLDSWPAFIPTTFELSLLFAAFAAVIAALAGSGLPRLMHPLFNLDAFRRASIDRFFLAIGSDDPRFDLPQTAEFLRTLAPCALHEIER